MEEYKSTPAPDYNLASHRAVPDVPEDVDSVMDHFNDLNWDTKSYPRSFKESLSAEKGKTATAYPYADGDSSFDRYSSSRAESRNSSADDFDDESPYPEVRAAVNNYDNFDMPVNTFRMWSLGMFWSILLPIFNMALGFRYPGFYITGLVIQLLVLPMGHFMAYILPTRQFNTFGYAWSFNPGPFNIKEHVCITVMANVSYPGAYATDVIVSQRLFYGQTLTMAYQMLLILGTQTYGFAVAGLLRRYVVYPSSMLWPGAIVNSALFNTLHKNFGKSDRGHMSREKFFSIVALGALVWYFIPGYLFTALSMFNWVCWIAPTNVTVNALFGASGLGMSGLTFDWSMIAFISSPMVTPWWAELNIIIGFVFVFWVIAPALYFTNAFNSAFLPISSYLSFDNVGMPYDISAVITNDLFDVEKYRAYSPLFFSSTLALEYGLAFALLPAVCVHTFLWFRRDIVHRFRSSSRDERDVHHRLMLAYDEVPIWWYAGVGLVSFIFIIVSLEVFDTKLPVWGALLAMFISILTAFPMAMLQAVANTQVAFVVILELIAGYIWPGRPIANAIFKSIGHVGASQAVVFSGDLKLGHYMKIPPRTMFTIQTVAVVLTCIFSVATQDWMFNNVDGMCTPEQAQGFICPSTTLFAFASVIWGGIGPARMFGPGAPFRNLLWFFLVGALLPIPGYLLARRFPNSFWRYINIPVLIAGIMAVPPASGLNYISWAIVGFVFNYYIRRFHFRWWMRYNYIVSAALDAGTALALVLLFLCLQLPKDGTLIVDWWGNNVWTNTADSLGTPLKSVPPGEIFGPSTWS